MAACWAARGSEPGVDEFTVPAEKSRLLEGSRDRIEGLFEVRLAVLEAQGDWRPAIPPPGPPPSAARIWVQLAGGGKAVRSAKEYIKGLCEPELEEKECYPKDMHCIFVGAQSLFLNSLIQDTCADITVLEIGLLSIKGGAEAVVMAQSHVQQFVKLFQNNESLLSDNESEIKKQFRQFVEAHADKYTMDLLILPSSLKRELLALTQNECCEEESNIIDLTGSESPTELLQDKASKVIATNRDGRAGGEEARNNAGTPVTELTKQMDTVFSDAPETSFVPINVVPLLEAVVAKERQSCKRRSSDDQVLSSQIHPSNPDRETVGQHRCHPDPSVTGVQRFLESLKKPYRLELKNEPGKPCLKHIIIDGSNVAMSHGLRKFFSCRGIAIAVDYFWKRGHRNITVFVPQWRTRRDPYITEQDFLTQLQDVGILSLTPARMVLGARIAAHDDRFLLHLADKTGGVIVTNDNFREFVTESLAWREIIQKRLLQYTFAGDIFMVPDDPLGRNGPRLDDFLRSEGYSRDFRSAQKALQSSGQYSSETPFFVPVSKPTSSSQQPKNRVHSDRSTAWLPLETDLEACLAIPPQRSASETVQLREALIKIFPDYEQRQKIDQILADHPFMRDLNALSAMVLD
ncbi:NEDD4-binding protein 1 [Grus japonensis]|uniref:NEDD4-binding protein 1 n=1 Tax=Grus japonensis TaxID=30415 RepID=A0ABC9XD38_GRUJA